QAGVGDGTGRERILGRVEDRQVTEIVRRLDEVFLLPETARLPAHDAAALRQLLTQAGDAVAVLLGGSHRGWRHEHHRGGLERLDHVAGARKRLAERAGAVEARDRVGQDHAEGEARRDLVAPARELARLGERRIARRQLDEIETLRVVRELATQAGESEEKSRHGVVARIANRAAWRLAAGGGGVTGG